MTCEDDYKKIKLKLKYKCAKSAKHCQLCIITEKLHLSPCIFAHWIRNKKSLNIHELNESSLFTLTLFMFNDVLTNIKRLAIVAREE